MKLSKKILAAVLAALMAVSMMPFSAVTVNAATEWSFSGNTLTITGTGAMSDYNSGNDVPWRQYNTSINSIVISNGITHIGAYAFNDCKVTNVSLPNTVKSIGSNSFNNCTLLASVTFPSSLESIGSLSFGGCNFTQVTIPASVTTIGMAAFVSNINLTKVVFERPSTEKSLSIGYNAFYKCYNSAEIDISGSGADLYYGSTKIESGSSPSQLYSTTKGETKTFNWVVPAVTGVAEVNGVGYETLAEAFAVAQDGDTITILADTTVDNTIVLNDGRNITIDTNGKTISSTKRVFEIRHGGVTLTGNGTVETTVANNSAVAVYGSTNSTDADYATFTLGAGTTISAPNGYGAMIGANNKAAYGAKLTLNGTIDSKYGVYVNGTVQEPADKTNAAQVTINGTVTADNENAAVYAAGYAKWAVNAGSTITGGSGIYIKSGDLTVNGGTITATGTKTAYKFNSNGADGTGDAIIIDSCGYPGNVPTVAINAGTISSTNGAAVASYTKQDDPLYPTAEFPRVDEVIPATSTAVFSSDVSALAADGYETNYDSTKGGYVVVTDDHTAAKIGKAKYDSLAEAIAAAQDGDTITLVANSTGDGISIAKNKFPTGLTVDFAGYTYTCNENYAGSTGTQRQVFQLNEGNTINFKNGTIESEGARMLIQNYSNLTLDNMTLNHEGHADFSDKVPYALSNNNGNVVIKDTAINACDDGFAFDACRYSSYNSVFVTVTGESVINGNVELSASGNNAKDGLSVNFVSGTLNGEVVLDPSAETAMNSTPAKAFVQKASTFVAAPPVGYMWDDETGKLVPSTAEDAYSITANDNIDLNFYIETETSDVDHLVITHSDPAKDNGSTITVTKPVATLETYVVPATATEPAKEYKVYKVNLAPAQLKDNIKISVYEDATNVQRVIETSVDEYCRTLIAMDDAALGAKATELKGLAKSTLDYGKAASAYFEYNDSAFAGVANELAEPDLNDERLAVPSGSNSYSFAFTGVSYVATTVPELRFTIDSSISENYLTELNETIETNIGEAKFVKINDGGTYRRVLQITNIDITDFGKQIVVTAGGDTILRFVPLTWAKSAAKSTTNAKVAALGKSICNYYINSVEYFGIKA